MTQPDPSLDDTREIAAQYAHQQARSETAGLAAEKIHAQERRTAQLRRGSQQTPRCVSPDVLPPTRPGARAQRAKTAASRTRDVQRGNAARSSRHPRRSLNTTPRNIRRKKTECKASADASHPVCPSTTAPAETSSEQIVREWARGVAASLPPLTESRVAAVAKLTVRADARVQQARADASAQQGRAQRDRAS